MNKPLINAFAAIFILSSTAAMAQQKLMDGMIDMPMGKLAAGQSAHIAQGKVKKVDAANGVVTITHEPVKSLNWPAMTMGFKVKYQMLLDKITVGKTIDFEFAKTSEGYVIFNVK